jgi:spermidine synthase/MFS family permease
VSPADAPSGAPNGAPIPSSRLRPAEASLLTFVAAACVLVLEIAAARLLAPYTGVSLTTTTSIIGVILGGIALGAWAGGRAADRVGPDRLLGGLFAAGGVGAMAAVPIAGLLGPAFAGSGPDASFVLSLVAFVLPAALLSAVAPVIVRATIRDVEGSGTVVGRLSAIGTAGALTGTFLTGYVLLGLAPVRALIAGTGVALVVLGVLVTLRLRRRPGAGIAALALLAVAFGALGLAAGSPCQRESAYYCVSVRPLPSDPSVRTLVLDDLLHARVDLDDPAALDFAYVRWFAAAAADLGREPDAPFDALHVGGGGFTFPRHLLERAPWSRHGVLELDPVILATAREELGLAPDPRIDVRLGDARRTIAGIADNSRDVVVGDAFASRSVPWHLATAEFVAEIDRVLRPDGRYVLNLIDGPRLAFARAEAATLRDRFEHVAVITWGLAFDGESGGNVVLVASHDPLDVGALEARVRAETREARVLHDPAALDAFTAGAPVLTDDFAPTDQLLGG